MRRKKTAVQSASGNAGLDISLQDIVDSVEDELLVIDSEYRLRFANSAALNRLEKDPRSPIGKSCYVVLHNRNKPCGVPLWNCPLKKVLESGTTTTVVHPTRVLGTDVYLKITAYPLQDSDGNVWGIAELRRDVTAERELETQILRRHHQLSVLGQVSSAVSGLRDLDVILRIALDNVLDLISGAVGGILLLDERTKTLYYHVQRGLSSKYTESRQIRLGEGIAGRVAQTGESILVDDVSKDPRAARPDLVSTEGIKGFISIPLRTKDEVLGVMNIFSHEVGRFGADDVSLLNSIGDYLGTTIEQARLYERLMRVGERNRALLQHALTTQEQERKRIARELHDETSQSLTSLTLSLMALIGMAEMKGIGDAEFVEKLKKTHANAVHAGNEIVKLMKELRPTLLDELGLPAAIHRYAKDSLETQGIKVSAKFKGTDRRFQPEAEVTLFRIAQGAIGNILEHSEAKNVSIKLECNDTECTLVVADDGKGFDVSKLTRVDPSGRGAGLFTMRERTSLLGGTGNVESQPGHGTQIIVKVPLIRDVEDPTEGMMDEEDKSTDS